MTKIIENITNLIGESPIVQLSHTPKESAKIYLKLERFNPGGSVKDRIALSMVKAAERQGLVRILRYNELSPKMKNWLKETTITEYEQASEHPEYRFFLEAKFGDLLKQ